MRTASLAAGLALAIAVAQPHARQAPAASKDIKLPPLSYICTMAGDEDVIEDKPGKCRKCGMELHPIRLDSVWTCPVHAAVIKDQAGKCPIDGHDLVQMTMALSWTCPGVEKDSLTPGTCADGSAMRRKYTARPHGNHNPQHGGGFFMAPDNWHHLEGAYFAPGVFRLYLYDDYTKPLPLAQVRATQARLIVDGKDVPLVRKGRYLEAAVGKRAFPTAMQARVKFKPEGPESLFDFTFEKYSKDAPAPANAMTAATPTPAPPVPAPAPATLEIAPATEGAFGSTPIPETVPELLAQLRARDEQIRTFIDRGAFGNVYVPAFQAKDLALALDAKKSGLAADRQRIVGPAVSRLVRTAYLLDAFGDLGNKQQIADAYTRFAAAVKDIETAFPK
jgi:hypothetical protein